MECVCVRVKTWGEAMNVAIREVRAEEEGRRAARAARAAAAAAAPARAPSSSGGASIPS